MRETTVETWLDPGVRGGSGFPQGPEQPPGTEGMKDREQGQTHVELGSKQDAQTPTTHSTQVY